MAQVFTREQPKKGAASRKTAGDLKVDDSRFVSGPADPVRLLGQVVVRDAMRMHAAQLAQRSRKIPPWIESRLVHRRTDEIGALQPRPRPRDEFRKARPASQPSQRASLPARECTSQPAQGGHGGARVAHDEAGCRIQIYRAERVPLEPGRLPGDRLPGLKVLRFHALDLLRG